MSAEISKVNQHSKKHHHHNNNNNQTQQPQPQQQQQQEFQDASIGTFEKTTKSKSSNVNYISVGMKRFKELALPVMNLLNSLSQSQRLMALLAVGIIFFWPIFLFALNLPWMLIVGGSIYALYFGKGKFYSDANEAVKDHFSVDIEAKGREVQVLFEQSQFPGKETLISTYEISKDFIKMSYKSFLLFSMTVLDYLVNLLLNLARTAKNLAAKEGQ